MQTYDREVTLKLNSRPLKYVYLVRDREEFLDAVALYTQVWGGVVNVILPIPNGDAEISDFKTTLQWINPDYIFVPREGLPPQVSQVLDQLPVLLRPISRDEVQKHINGSRDDLLRLFGGVISRMETILPIIYPEGLKESKIRLIEEGTSYDFELAVQTGTPTQKFQNYLGQRLGATTYSRPTDIKELLRLSLVISKYLNPIRLTMDRTGTRFELFHSYLMMVDDPETLCIFLDDGQSIDVAAAFWNTRWSFPANKVILPKDGFLNDLESLVSLIVQFIPFIRAVYITVASTPDDATVMHENLKSVFATAGHEILIKICYSEFKFDSIIGSLYSGEKTNFTRSIGGNGSVRFAPSTPVGHTNTEFTFGYTAEVKFESGSKFFSPNTRKNSILLTNELWRIEYAENDKEDFGELWLRRDLPVRATPKGITGITLPGREACFYIHPDEVVISTQLKEAGLEVKLNKHTRYAQGLVKRLNGLGEVVSLFNNGGSEIIAALVARRAEQQGLYRDGIIAFLERNYGWGKKQINEILNQKLSPLLASGLIRRGYPLQCPNCNLQDWFSLEEISEFVECRGCAENFQTPLHGLQFTYKPNELVARLVQEGGLVVLMTAALFRKIPSSTSGFIQFGGDIFRAGSKTNFAEIDLFWLAEDTLVISECKSLFVSSDKADQHQTDERLADIQKSVEKNIDVAVLINARVLILSVSTNLVDLSKLFEIVDNVAPKAKENNVGLHLAINGKLFVAGDTDGVEPQRIRLDSLLVEDEPQLHEAFVGESPDHYGGTVGARGIFDIEVFERWEQELRLQGS